MTIFLVVGLPGAGKTTRAKELEVSESALRLTPDDWQMAVFHDDSSTRWRSAERSGQRDRLEAKLVQTGMRAAQSCAESRSPPVAWPCDLVTVGVRAMTDVA